MRSGSWGLLRNALQEFPNLTWLGVDNSQFNARVTPLHMRSDAFGIANTGSRWSTPRLLQNKFAAAPNQGSSTNSSTWHSRHLNDRMQSWSSMTPIAVRQCTMIYVHRLPGVVGHGMSQLITGGLGGLGVLMASWFAQLDRNINLVDIHKCHTYPTILQNSQSQASITIARGDICAAENASCAMKLTQTPSFGILHAAGVLEVRDNPF